mmetsp:Transcript_27869/g.67181  ORF Transcript_27869/g.67181 Transcript_27869/m.67181 type:complete len:91 (+) Transcript_27869:408-680(+)|eukprot:CAMPEP_0181101528 /NCGR_PEP_ID=MMETSP1071-20121207/13804_1 /TAXON_ID=35127 /ORGANISM="Thalassiosira sp., Strain NH16" /LENGTH=90 /DNA_ID=CAMNT_0023184389 /DNA_START=403 /DNA_END=675 /DNA_ORIENTATION=+
MEQRERSGATYRGEQSATANNNKRAPPGTRVVAYRVGATAGGEQMDDPGAIGRPIAVQGCDDPRGIGTPRLLDFLQLASGYALGLVHGHK